MIKMTLLTITMMIIMTMMVMVVVMTILFPAIFLLPTEPKAPDIHADYKSVVLVDEKYNMSITVGSNATVYARSVLVLICNASSSPHPDIYWTKNGDDIFGSQVDEDRKLYLFHDPAQNGEYSCEARNFMGSAKSSSYITFIGEAISFYCQSL